MSPQNTLQFTAISAVSAVLKKSYATNKQRETPLSHSENRLDFYCAELLYTTVRAKN
jgi:hypothetical protein